MSSPRFSLDRQRPTRKFTCPACGRREFKRYLDEVSGDLFHAEHVGRCNRELNCGYHYPPRQYFADHPTLDTGQALYRPCPVSGIPNVVANTFSTIPLAAFEGSFRCFTNNHFVVFLEKLFGIDLTRKLLQRFLIGTAKAWPGATVFWQLDELGNVRAGKIMLYNSETGKRVKKPFDHVQWVHSVLKLRTFRLQQCLFGLHQIRLYPADNPVCIVESEKTAILMTALLPDYTWLATGGSHNLNPDKCTALNKREIRLYPDLGCFSLWSEKAEKMKNAGYSVTVSDLLERFCSEQDRISGYDLADYFIRRDPDFGWALTEDNYPLFWDAHSGL